MYYRRYFDNRWEGGGRRTPERLTCGTEYRTILYRAVDVVSRAWIILLFYFNARVPLMKALNVPLGRENGFQKLAFEMVRGRFAKQYRHFGSCYVEISLKIGQKPGTSIRSNIYRGP